VCPIYSLFLLIGYVITYIHPVFGGIQTHNLLKVSYLPLDQAAHQPAFIYIHRNIISIDCLFVRSVAATNQLCYKVSHSFGES
jgi:hypothetical protein